MTPDERQLLAGLFDRIRAASGQPRDREAEDFISQAAREQPYAPYLLAQTVLVQEQALSAANERLQQLEARVHELESASSGSSGGSFLGGIGKSIFGGSEPARPQTSVPTTGGSPWGRTSNDAPPVQQGGWGQQAPQPYGQTGGPWQAQPQQQQGGSFLRGALGAAAGVAGGMLLANSIRGLFEHQGNPFGIGSGFGNMGAGGDAMSQAYGSGPALDGSRGNMDMSDIFPASGSDDAGSDDGGGYDDDDSSDDTTDV